MLFLIGNIYDTCVRADENPIVTSSSGIAYADYPDLPSIGATQLKIVSNNIAGNGGAVSNNYLNVVDSAACENGGVISTAGATSDIIDFLIRQKDMTAVLQGDGYSVRTTFPSTIGLYRVDNAASTLLGSSFSQTVSAGDSVAVQMIGSILEAFYKPSAGAWASLGIRTDSTYPLGGYRGISIIGTTARINNLFGGSLSSQFMSMGVGA